MPNLTNTIEQAVAMCLQAQFTGLGVTPSPPIYVSDVATVKDAMPYVVLHADEALEIEAPGCGIFTSTVMARFRSHVKDSTPEYRTSVVEAMNNFAYDSPYAGLNAIDGFHTYGFIPATGRMEVNQEIKAYEYQVTWTFKWMPRNNE